MRFILCDWLHCCGRMAVPGHLLSQSLSGQVCRCGLPVWSEHGVGLCSPLRLLSAVLVMVCEQQTRQSNGSFVCCYWVIFHLFCFWLTRVLLMANRWRTEQWFRQQMLREGLPPLLVFRKPLTSWCLATPTVDPLWGEDGYHSPSINYSPSPQQPPPPAAMLVPVFVMSQPQKLTGNCVVHQCIKKVG